ncbi:MAG: channel, pore region [Bryobacterales bacterium]|nr:channel, pore region [Bryobacterales bacterium]
MRFIAALLGCFLIGMILVDAFHTIILARRSRHAFRITRFFYVATWKPFAAVARRIDSSQRREDFLGIYGPLSLVLILALWALGLIVSFGFLQWGVGMRPSGLRPTLPNDLYLSATTLFTLDSGNPQNAVSKVVTAFEAGLGFSLLGLVIGYLPVFYQAFSRRELQISLLDARAGSPPSALCLLQLEGLAAPKIERRLEAWERWAAEILENQLSFPMMAWFRSHHANQSWVTALTVMVDSAAVISLCGDGDLKAQAELTFAMGRHALADITAILKLHPASPQPGRLSHDDFARLRAALENVHGPLHWERISEDKLAELRRMYEPQAEALSSYLLMALPEWTFTEQSRENWRASRPQEGDVPFAVSDPFQQERGETAQ